MARSVARAAGVGIGTGVIHGLAHLHFGEQESFSEAGVTEVGLTVTAASFALALALQSGDLTLV